MRFSMPEPERNENDGLSLVDAMRLLMQVDQVTIHVHRLADAPTVAYELKGVCKPGEFDLIGPLIDFATRPISESDEDESDETSAWN